VQTTVALSKLNLSEDQYLRRSLAAILQFSTEDKDVSQTKFPKQLKDVVDKLFVILRDSVKMGEHQEDLEMMSDMNHRIAQGYMNAPDLRLASLETLMKLQFRSKNWAETAFCLLHSAALVSQCLKTMHAKKGIKDSSHLPNGAKAFSFVSPNFLEEEASTTEGEGIGESPAFADTGLIELLEKSIPFLRRGHLYEMINEVYKLLIPILEKKKDYEKLSNIHFELHKDFTALNNLNNSGKRMFATYFRVAFFGNLFKVLNGQEYIYREKPVTPLSEISTHLEEQFSKKFGADNFKLIQDSGFVDVSKLNPNIAYIQITFCEPYFTPEELAQRDSVYDRNMNINRFVFDTPYTPSGKPHGTVEDQHMKRTMLTTEYYFPYIKKRIRVSGRQEIDLKPIEVSIEAINTRVQAFRNVLSATSVDPKSLQLILQGTVRVTVNDGPLEISSTFLAADKISKYPPQQVEQLKEKFREFLRSCYEALTLNRGLVKHDQKAYQEDLEAGFEEMKKKIWPYISDGASPTILGFGIKTGEKDVLTFISGVDDSD